MAVLAPLYPFRNVVLLTDWGFGSVNHIMKLKGHVISFQTNHKERIKALKEALFRFDLHERWFVVFCGKEEHFKINSILNHGDNFCGLFQCDIRNCVNWVIKLLEVGCTEVEQYRNLIEDPSLYELMKPKADEMNRMLAENMQLDDGENTKEYRQFMASDVTEQVRHPGGPDKSENTETFREDIQYTFVADPLMSARSQVESVLRSLADLVEDVPDSQTSDKDGSSSSGGYSTSDDSTSSNKDGYYNDEEISDVDNQRPGENANSTYSDTNSDDGLVTSSRITFKVHGEPLNEYTQMNAILSQLFMTIFHQGYKRPFIAPSSGYLNRTDRRKVMLYADRVAAQCSPLLQTLFDMLIRQRTAGKAAFRSKAGLGAQERALALFKKELQTLPKDKNFSDPIIAKRMAPIMRMISKVIAVQSTPLP